ncbi:unnamed protein product [Caenorhabditis nigoni]
MTNSSTIITASTILLILILILAPSTHASGTIELLVTSPRTILLEPTVCANFECAAPDELSSPRKVQGELRFNTGRYQGESREAIDVHLKVIEPGTNAILAIEHHRPLADNEWNRVPIVVTTSAGFNVTVQLRNKCDSNYHGHRCGSYCIPSPDHHWECSPQGQRRCLPGWTGGDCSTPICASGCNGHGKCVAPNQCACINGYKGAQCEQCVPRAGCLNGQCHNDVPNTCKCRDGFIGDRCDIDVQVCSIEKPCANGGRCSIDTKSPNGYKCECPFDFLGPQCKTPLASVKCSATAKDVCQNGGACISMDDRTIQCKCRPGFTGKFCEYGTHGDCSTLKCASPTATCHMSGDLPICVESNEVVATTTTTKSVKVLTKKRKMEQEAAPIEQDPLLVISLLLLSVIGLILAIILGYFRYYVRVRDVNAAVSTLPMTMSPTSKTSTSSRPPVYKVCIIDTECGTSSDPHLHHPRHHNSPPPAYTSPMMPRVYRSLPQTTDDDTFRDPSRKC